MSLADLGAKGCPSDGAGLSPLNARWVISRKLQLLSAIQGGRISLEEASERYLITMQELLSWHSLNERHGARGLLTTQVQKYRREAESRRLR